MRLKEEPRLLTTREVAKLLKVSEASVRRWSSRGRLRCYRLGPGRERRFLLDEVLAFLQREEGTPRASNGGHFSFFFRHEEEQGRVMGPLLASQLEKGQPVVYIRDTIRGEEPPPWLCAPALPAPHLLALYTPTQTYLQEGYFDPDRMYNFLRTAAEEALGRGHRSVLLTGEVSWALDDPPGSHRLMECEARLNAITEQYPQVSIICQYNLNRFGGATVVEALLTHPLVLLGGHQYRGFYQAAP